jgi:hypothetical protein
VTVVLLGFYKKRRASVPPPQLKMFRADALSGNCMRTHD